jgi:integrase
MSAINQKQLSLNDEKLESFQRDIWQAKEFGSTSDTVHAMYQLNFYRIQQDWFKIAIKKFILFQAATKSFASCISYLGRLADFSEFIVELHPNLLPEQVNRKIIVEYISYLAKSSLGTVTRGMSLIHLRTFHSIVTQENWLPWPKEPLIYASDIPKKSQHLPRYIPEFVIAQLQKKLHHLPEYMRNLITILLETGRRIGEICTLPLNCLDQDEQGDYFLTVNDRKLKKTYLIPISDSCIKAIKAQQKMTNEECPKNKQYLFTSRRKNKTPHVSANFVNFTLRKLAHDHKIVGENGEIWGFSTHQFRHTVGTRMINAGVPQTIVQKYLGHESPEMTSRYAHIHDETLKVAFNNYQGKLIDIHGDSRRRNNQGEYAEAKWLQFNTMAQALPNGICGLPSPQQRCPHANACLTCVHFRTHKEFLPQHQNQLDMTNKIIEAAKSNGWQRQVEMNIAVKNNLEKIITTLQEEK